MYDMYKEIIPSQIRRELLFSMYLQSNPEKYKNTELELFSLYSEKRYDAERVGGKHLWCTSQKFKDFMESEGVPFDFYPIKVEGERRYLTMRLRLPVLSDYECDLENSRYTDGHIHGKRVFRSDFLEYYDHKVFRDFTASYVYCSKSFKDRLESSGLMLRYVPIATTEVLYDESNLQADSLRATRMERELFLTEWRYKMFEGIDDTLEKILIQDDNQQALNKFRSEIKGRWKDQFERYRAGTMPPEERVIYW
jgi:hypothetical protein